jgi:hypothetical protein
MSIWKSLNHDFIHNNDTSEEFKTENNCLNHFMHKYIFNKYKHNTIAEHLRKTSSGYSFSRRCNKWKKEKCKSRWNLQINLSDKSAHLDCKFMCDHIASSINLMRSRPG